MSATSSVLTQAQTPREAVAWRPLALALVATILVTAFRIVGRVDSDVAWQLWIAGRIHAGANLYTDIIETNPPLWFWMALPLDRISSLLQIRIEAVAIGAMGVLVAISLAATDRLTRAGIDPVRRALFLTYAALVLAAMPWMHVGQREQIVLVAALPYAALVAQRRQQQAVSPPLAAAVGLAAALGFALKHYFLIVPLILELWLITGARKQWRPVRPEVVAIAIVGLLYAAAILILEPDFLSRIVPLVQLAYGAFGAPSVRYMFGPFAIVGCLIMTMVGLQALRIAASATPMAHSLLAAAIGFAFVYFIQFKGWPYHAIPLIGCSALALAAMLVEMDEPPAILRMIAPALLLMPLVLSAEEQMHPALPGADLSEAVSGLGPSDAVGFLTTETAIPWSVTLQGGYRYASRYNGFWMMRAIIRNEASEHPDPALTRLGRQIVSETVSDFTCVAPRRIIITRPRKGETTFDILPFFLRDPAFATLLSHYRVRSRTSLETYQLVSPIQPARGTCRSGI